MCVCEREFEKADNVASFPPGGGALLPSVSDCEVVYNTTDLLRVSEGLPLPHIYIPCL